MEEILKMSQLRLFKYLRRSFSCVSRKNDYIFIQGEAPVLLVAHLDTVHDENVKTICYSQDKNILMSPQGIGGDDRCGVYGLLQVYDQASRKPSLLFTCDEEVGGIGARSFVSDFEKGKIKGDMDFKFIIELDRKGRNDAVFYDCVNEEFEDYILSKGFKFECGSFSDISLVAPALGVAAVNLSCGYYNPHTLHEYINLKHLNATIKKVVAMVEEAGTLNKFSYIPFDVYDYDDKWDIKNYPSDWLKDDLSKIYGWDTINMVENLQGREGLENLYLQEYGAFNNDAEPGYEETTEAV